jgi:NTE family protein
MTKQKTALVLSAGGMFGAYQAGAYQAICEHTEIDLVVGASVGALNGWPIASGCTPEHLTQRWLDPATGRALSLFPDAGWHSMWNRRWFDPAPLREQAEEIHRQYTPRIPFGLVVVQVAGFRTKLIRHPHVRPAHLHATCSIPLFLPAVRIDGMRYLDGGFFEKLPIFGALEMGATRIIAVDSLPSVGPKWLRTGINAVRVFKPRRRLPENLDFTLISPSEQLGDVNDAVHWKRSNMERWIELGLRDGRNALAGRASLAA